jgi:hypothetical protein
VNQRFITLIAVFLMPWLRIVPGFKGDRLPDSHGRGNDATEEKRAPRLLQRKKQMMRGKSHPVSDHSVCAASEASRRFLNERPPLARSARKGMYSA